MSEFSPEEHSILLITCPAHFFTHFFTLVFPAIAIPLTTAFGMPLEQVVKLSFWMYLLYGVLAIPVGLAADHWRAKPLMAGGIALMGAGLVVAGAVPSPFVMPLALAAVGVGASVYHPAGIALISHTVRLRGLALGVNGVFGSLGIALAPLVTGLVTWAFGWQTALVTLGIVGLVTALLVQRVHVDETIRPHTASRTTPGRSLLPIYLLLCIALVLGGIAYRGNMILVPAYLELKTTFLASFIDRLPLPAGHGNTTLAASILASLVFFAGLAGQVAGGRMADRVELRRAYLFFHALSFPFLLAMAFTSEAVLVVCAVLYGFFAFGMQPVENSLIAGITPVRWRSTSFAVKFLLTFGIGSSVVQIIAPIKTRYSVEMVYAFLGGVVFLLAVCALAMVLVRRVPPIRN